MQGIIHPSLRQQQSEVARREYDRRENVVVKIDEDLPRPPLSVNVENTTSSNGAKPPGINSTPLSPQALPPTASELEEWIKNSDRARRSTKSNPETSETIILSLLGRECGIFGNSNSTTGYIGGGLPAGGQQQQPQSAATIWSCRYIEEDESTCCKLFTRRDRAVAHVRKHLESRRHRCGGACGRANCPQQFYSDADLKQHTRPRSQSKCEACGTSILTKNMGRHKQSQKCTENAQLRGLQPP